MSPAVHRRCSLSAERGGIFLKLLGLMFLVILIGLLYVAGHPLLHLAGEFWVVDESPVPADAIVMLGDDNYSGDRATRAAELSKAGWAPRVIASGRYLRPYASIAELEEHDLVDRGVPKTAVVLLEHRAQDTLEECLAIGQLASSRGWKRLIVVTSNYHTRRTRYICGRTLPAGTAFRVVAAQDSEYDPANWWSSRQGIKIFAHEFAGMFVAAWELRHNDVRTSEASVVGLTGLLVAGGSTARRPSGPLTP